MSEPFNTILIVVMCVLGTLHINGFFALSKKSPSVIWLKTKPKVVLASLSFLFVFVAVAKTLLLLL